MMNNIQNHVEIYVCVYECERIRLARVSLNFLIPVPSNFVFFRNPCASPSKCLSLAFDL